MDEILSFHWLDYDHPFTVKVEEQDAYTHYSVEFVKTTGALHEEIKLPLIYTVEGNQMKHTPAHTENGKDIIAEIWKEISNRYELPPSKFEADGFEQQ
jgi:hypothetical protein